MRLLQKLQNQNFSCSWNTLLPFETYRGRCSHFLPPGNFQGVENGNISNKWVRTRRITSIDTVLLKTKNHRFFCLKRVTFYCFTSKISQFDRSREYIYKVMCFHITELEFIALTIPKQWFLMWLLRHKTATRSNVIYDKDFFWLSKFW